MNATLPTNGIGVPRASTRRCPQTASAYRAPAGQVRDTVSRHRTRDQTRRQAPHRAPSRGLYRALLRAPEPVSVRPRSRRTLPEGEGVPVEPSFRIATAVVASSHLFL